VEEDMAGTFSFGFAGDDIDDIDDVNENEPGQSSSSNSYQKETHHAESSPELFPAERHQLQDWVRRAFTFFSSLLSNLP
jgi:hypothetical protein